MTCATASYPGIIITLHLHQDYFQQVSSADKLFVPKRLQYLNNKFEPCNLSRKCKKCVKYDSGCKSCPDINFEGQNFVISRHEHEVSQRRCGLVHLHTRDNERMRDHQRCKRYEVVKGVEMTRFLQSYAESAMESLQGVKGARNEACLLTLIEKTGYPMVQENGQRKYGPPPKWEGPPPPRGCEIFIGKIPRDIYEDELVPVFEKAGKIYEFRLMMDFSGSNRGYAFCMYTNKNEAKRAITELNNFEIRKGRLLGVCSSVDNCRLFVGGIPKNKNREDILTEMCKVTEGVVDIIVYPSAVDKTKNRGFAFVEYESHRAAAMARRKLIPGRIQLWGHQIAVDWAEPEAEVDEDTMATVRLYSLL